MNFDEWRGRLEKELNKEDVNEMAILMRLKSMPFRVSHLYDVLRMLHSIGRVELLPSSEEVKQWISKGIIIT